MKKARCPREAIRDGIVTYISLHKNGQQIHECKMLNWSVRGCLLEVIDWVLLCKGDKIYITKFGDIPPQGKVLQLLQPGGGVPLQAEVSWVKGKRVGIHFASTDRLPSERPCIPAIEDLLNQPEYTDAAMMINDNKLIEFCNYPMSRLIPKSDEFVGKPLVDFLKECVKHLSGRKLILKAISDDKGHTVKAAFKVQGSRTELVQWVHVNTMSIGRTRWRLANFRSADEQILIDALEELGSSDAGGWNDNLLNLFTPMGVDILTIRYRLHRDCPLELLWQANSRRLDKPLTEILGIKNHPKRSLSKPSEQPDKTEWLTYYDRVFCARKNGLGMRILKRDKEEFFVFNSDGEISSPNDNTKYSHKHTIHPEMQKLKIRSEAIFPSHFKTAGKQIDILVYLHSVKGDTFNNPDVRERLKTRVDELQIFIRAGILEVVHQKDWTFPQLLVRNEFDSVVDEHLKIVKSLAEVIKRDTKTGRVQKSDLDPTVALIDLDHLKSTNDTYGHQAGDHLIGAFVQCLKNTAVEFCCKPHNLDPKETDYLSWMRQKVCLSRYSRGDEFGAFFKRSTDAEEYLKSLRDKTRKMKVPLESRKLKLDICFSAGWVSYSELKNKPRTKDKTGKSFIKVFGTRFPWEGIEEKRRTLIEVADKCLMLAKETGRDRNMPFGPIDNLKISSS